MKKTSRVLRFRNLVVLGLLVIIAGAVYGFAAANTVKESAAGDGEGDISGYTITNISYDLDADDPSLLDSVSFNVAVADTDAGAATEVAAQIAGEWFTCANAGGTTFDCAIGGAVSVLNAEILRVVAVQ